jgi:hypothetical protein
MMRILLPARCKNIIQLHRSPNWDGSTATVFITLLNTEVLLDIPITFNKPVIEYFIIYKSINGLMNGRVGDGADPLYRLSNLPEGQEVTLIAFIKNKGQLFQSTEEFVIKKGKPVQLNFKNISPEEMTKMFGKNVRI